MFIDPLSTPGYRRTLLNAIVAPRPIGWISTVDSQGRANLAPFSQFNLVSTAPPVVMFACNTPEDRPAKDTLANARATGQFVVNLASWPLREAVNRSSVPCPPGTDEFALVDLAKAECRHVSVPRVARSPANLECRVLQVIDILPEHPGETASQIVLGRVVGIHLDDACVSAEGRFDTVKAQPLTRLGGLQYATLGEVFEMPSQFQRVAS